MFTFPNKSKNRRQCDVYISTVATVGEAHSVGYCLWFVYGHVKMLGRNVKGKRGMLSHKA